MGDPMAPSDSEGNSQGGGRARRFASRQAKRAGITRPQLLEMSRPGAPAGRKGSPIQLRMGSERIRQQPELAPRLHQRGFWCI